MNFLTAAKDLEKAKEQIAALEANAATLTAENAKLKADMDAAMALSNELSAKLTAAESAAAEAKTALETAKAQHAEAISKATAETEKAASIKAAQVVAAVGHQPVKSDSAPTKASIREIYNAMKPGPERDAFRKQHPEHFSLN
jgi:chromosome segregation ATPase